MQKRLGDAEVTSMNNFRTNVLNKKLENRLVSPRTNEITKVLFIKVVDVLRIECAIQERPPFSPCCPSKAKEPLSDRVPGLTGCSYGIERELKMKEARAHRARILYGDFKPSGSDAPQTTEVRNISSLHP